MTTKSKKDDVLTHDGQDIYANDSSLSKDVGVKNSNDKGNIEDTPQISTKTGGNVGITLVKQGNKQERLSDKNNSETEQEGEQIQTLEDLTNSDDDNS